MSCMRLSFDSKVPNLWGEGWVAYSIVPKRHPVREGRVQLYLALAAAMLHHDPERKHRVGMS